MIIISKLHVDVLKLHYRSHYLGGTVTIGLPAFCEIIFSCIKLLSDYYHFVCFILGERVEEDSGQ